MQVLILVPSRELALQIDSVFKSNGDFLEKPAVVTVDILSPKKKKKYIEQIILLSSSVLRDVSPTICRKGNFNPETIETLIIDEFDKSLEFGFHDENGRDYHPASGIKKKRMLLSATDAAEIPEFTGLNRTVKVGLPFGRF